MFSKAVLFSALLATAANASPFVKEKRQDAGACTPVISQVTQAPSPLSTVINPCQTCAPITVTSQGQTVSTHCGCAANTYNTFPYYYTELALCEGQVSTVTDANQLITSCDVNYIPASSYCPAAGTYVVAGQNVELVGQGYAHYVEPVVTQYVAPYNVFFSNLPTKYIDVYVYINNNLVEAYEEVWHNNYNYIPTVVPGVFSHYFPENGRYINADITITVNNAPTTVTYTASVTSTATVTDISTATVTSVPSAVAVAGFQQLNICSGNNCVPKSSIVLASTFLPGFAAPAKRAVITPASVCAGLCTGDCLSFSVAYNKTQGEWVCFTLNVVVKASDLTVDVDFSGASFYVQSADVSSTDSIVTATETVSATSLSSSLSVSSNTAVSSNTSSSHSSTSSSSASTSGSSSSSSSSSTSSSGSSSSSSSSTRSFTTTYVTSVQAIAFATTTFNQSTTIFQASTNTATVTSAYLSQNTTTTYVNSAVGTSTTLNGGTSTTYSAVASSQVGTYVIPYTSTITSATTTNSVTTSVPVTSVYITVTTNVSTIYAKRK